MIKLKGLNAEEYATIKEMAKKNYLLRSILDNGNANMRIML
ncbi:hypothetical protein ACT7CM_27270 [Bacillus paranthracis]